MVVNFKNPWQGQTGEQKVTAECLNSSNKDDNEAQVGAASTR